MRIDLQHALSDQRRADPSATEIVLDYCTQVRAFLDRGDYHAPECALFAPTDRVTHERVKELVAPFARTLRTVLLVGIGGSDLGTRAVYDALHPHHTAVDRPRLIVLSTIDPCLIKEARDVISLTLDPHEIALVVVSKSGTTMETLTNANIIYAALRDRFGDAANARTIVISDPDTPIASEARAMGFNHVPMPKAVGGRYSVFTPVGLVPLALLGFDIDRLCDGASAAVQTCFTPVQSSPAAQLAMLLASHYRAGFLIHEFFAWHPELETLGKWYRQLLSESIGKHDVSGISVGITPAVAIGSTDLHSLGQLVFGGPHNRFTTFVAAPSAWAETDMLSDDAPFSHHSLRGKRAGDVIRAIYTGVSTSYQSERLPFVAIELDSITEREVGACMALHMGMVMYLARILSVNAFDQPDVERYKQETRRILAS